MIENEEPTMRVKVLIYQAKEGGYWAKIPGLPGCVSEGETLDEVKANLSEAVAGVLSLDEPDYDAGEPYEVHELEL